MSEEVKSEEQTTECSVCGFVPGPHPSCSICHGNRAFFRTRQYTRSEEVRGDAPEKDDRYSRTGDVSPKIVNLPGSARSHG
jgi:hypothetical protein